MAFSNNGNVLPDITSITITHELRQDAYEVWARKLDLGIEGTQGSWALGCLSMIVIAEFDPPLCF